MAKRREWVLEPLSRKVKRGAKTSRLTNADISQWIDNDEGLYLWWKRSRQSKTAFIHANHKELVAAIRRVLNAPPRS